MISYTQAMTDCWSKDFDYQNYKLHAERIGAHVVPEQSYKLHCQAMDIDMEANIGKDSQPC